MTPDSIFRQEKSSMDSTRDIFKDRVPIRATYNNLFKRPDSEREFLESIIADVHDGSVRMYGHPMVVASFMSRQLFLRSYPFIREEDYKKTIGCFSCYKAEEVHFMRKRNSNSGGVKCARLRRAKKVACSALKSVFRHVVTADKYAAKGGPEFSFVVNIQVRRPITFLCIYDEHAALEDAPLLESSVNGDDAYRNPRFKLIPHISKGSWIVKQSVGKKTCLIGQALEINFFRGKNYFEKRLDDMLYVGLTENHRESAIMFGNVVGAQVISQHLASRSSTDVASNDDSEQISSLFDT